MRRSSMSQEELREDLFMGNVKEAIIARLEAVKRDGMPELIKWLSGNDFFTAPASTKYHGAFVGGLAAHSLQVATTMEALNQALGLGYSAETINIVGLLHDVCKTNTYGKAMKSQKAKNPDGSFKLDHKGKPVWEDVETWDYLDSASPLGHGEKSVILLLKHIELTGEEILAINWHMGRQTIEPAHMGVARP
jgi:hypothetical protein